MCQRKAFRAACRRLKRSGAYAAEIFVTGTYVKEAVNAKRIIHRVYGNDQ